MSFPGYLKSLNLVHKREDDLKTASKANDDSTGKTSTNSHVYSSTKNRNDSSIATELTTGEEVVLDEKGNAPTRSLWVGNIPSKTTSTEVRARFSRFGPIVSTRPQAKYAFVNFERVESAITAFKTYHDQDLFNTGNSTINIRFTGTLEEAKQAKDDFREHRSSTTTKAEAAQKQWFQPVDTQKSASSPLSSDRAEWPNGKPPSGPKSQRKEISPPPLRRSDTYRPSELPRGNSHRSEPEHRRADRDKYHRGRDHRRRSSQHYSPEYSSSHSQSPVRTPSSRASPRYKHRVDESPLPWERRRGEQQFRNLVWTKDSESVAKDDSNCAAHRESIDEHEPNSGKCQVLDTQHVKAESDAICPPSIHLGTPDEPEDGELCSNGYADDVDTRSMEHKEDLALLAPVISFKHLSKSPSLRPVERLRVEDASSRSSALSDIATSSSRTSTRKKKCRDCKRVASELTPLVPCSMCTRQFHSGCGDPKPSSCPDKSKYVCGRCRRKEETGSSLDRTSTQTNQLAKSSGKVHLVTPPLSLSQDGHDSTNLSPRDDLFNILSDEHRFESFFPTRPDVCELMAKSVAQQSSPDAQDARDTREGTRMDSLTNSQSRDNAPPQSIAHSSNPELVLANKNKYKVVTCKWWAHGNCTQVEDGCYYAHHQTATSFPDRKRVNKAWTCYDWLHDRCSMAEQDCLHAHKDTGLHIWRDGRPSLKHVTCFWWSRGRCKWDDEACKMAHEDTGLYSMDPSEILLGGGKFSTVHPLNSSSRLKQIRHSTGPHGLLDKDLDSTDLSQSTLALQSEGKDSRGNATAPMSTKPSLTIDTSTKTGTSEARLPINNVKSFPATIGAPPQTPNEDSPDKTNSHVFDGPPAFRFPMPDLPTPANEEQLQLENQSRGEGCTAVASILHTSAATRHQERQPGFREDCLLDTEEHKQPNIRPTHQTSRSESINGRILVQSPDKMQNDMTRDPRLLRPNRASEQLDPTVSSATSSSQEKSEFVPNTSLSTIDDVARHRVKKCQNCQKTVFKTDLCKTCSGGKHVSSAEHVSNQSRQSAAVTTNVTETIPGNSVLRESSNTSAPGMLSQPSVKSSLKRSMSGSYMFLKNKRLKTSMACSFSGSIRPDTFRQAPIVKRPSVTLSNTDSRRETQTLEDLIRKEREKKRTESMLDASTVQSPTSEGEKENVGQRSFEGKSNEMTGNSSVDAGDDPITPRTSITESFTSVGNNLFASPQQSPVVEKSAASTPTWDSKSARQPCNKESTGDKPSRPLSHGVGQWRSSESPEPQSTATALAMAKPSVSSPKPSESHAIESPKMQISDADFKRSVPANRPFPRDIPTSVEKFTWASPITCTICQKHHKKCLHDVDGSLSAVKCRDYVLSRKGKPDTGRSRQEWRIIVETSELDPNSDDDDSSADERSHVKPDQDLASDRSEEEYTTAVSGDDMSVDDMENVIDEGQALLEKFKQYPPVQIAQSSPKKKPFTLFAKFSTSNQNDDWTMAQEQAKNNDLRKKGVMFESEAEDEDYLSDDYEPPRQTERPMDPLHVPPKVSRDLFEVAPELDHNQYLRNAAQKKPGPRPSRKEQWAQLRTQQQQARRELFGNPTWEVNRIREDVYVTALVERIVPPRNTEDKFAVGSVQTREETVTFRDFLGIPKLPEICLMSDGERLGFRDCQKERDRTFGRTGRGLCKGVTDEEKWPVRAK